jgi:hypothetical protein
MGDAARTICTPLVDPPCVAPIQIGLEMADLAGLSLTAGAHHWAR